MLKGHAGDIAGLEFAPDGRTLASGSFDSTVLIWDVSGTRGAKGKPLGEAEQAACWDDLASAKPAVALAALWRLADGGDKAVAMLVKRLPVGRSQPAGKEAVRLRRAVRALQLAGTPAARKHLEALARGPSLSAEAKAALEHFPTAKK